MRLVEHHEGQLELFVFNLGGGDYYFWGEIDLNCTIFGGEYFLEIRFWVKLIQILLDKIHHH